MSSRRRRRTRGLRRADGTRPITMHSREFLEQVGAFGRKIVSLARIGLKIKQHPWEESRLGNVFPATLSNGFVRIAGKGTQPEERSVDGRPLPCENRSEVNPVKRPSRGRGNLRSCENGCCDVHCDRRL